MRQLPPPQRPSPAFQAPRGRSRFFDSFRHAWNGLVHTVEHQPNMRVHLLAGMLVGLVGSGIPLGLAEKVTMIFCVLMIFFAEILNSALEQLVDLAVQQFDEKARLTKDAAAAGVLVLAIGTVVIFAAIVVHNAEVISTHAPQIERQVAIGLPLTLLTGVLMRPRNHSRWLNTALVLAGLGLIAVLARWSESYVFSAMTFGLLMLAAAAARSRRLGSGAGKKA